MRILGIDTAIPTASVALVENGKLLAEAMQGGPAGNHAEVILPLIQSLLDKAKMALDDLSGIAISMGPGSFTGLRIGLATAKGMAYESNLALVGVSTLHAGAARVRNFDGLIGCMLDARKNEVYLALFYHNRETLTRLTPDAVVSVNSAVDLVRKYQTNEGAALLIGSGAQAYERELNESLGPSVRTAGGACYSSMASEVARLAVARFDAGETDDIGALAPVYLQASAAESKRKKLA